MATLPRIPAGKPTTAEVLDLLRELEAVQDPNTPAHRRREFQDRKDELLARLRGAVRYDAAPPLISKR